MSPGEKSLLLALKSAHGKAVVTSFYRLLEGVAARDEAGAMLAGKFQARGELLCRAAIEIEKCIDQLHTVRRQGRPQREQDIALRQWAGSLLNALIRWTVDGGATRVKGAVAAAKNARERNEAIVEAAGKLLQLLERHAGAMVSDFDRGVPHVSPDVALPHLRRDLHRLIHIVTGKRRQWRRALEEEIRVSNGIPPPKAPTVLAHGAQGLISEIDLALPFSLSSDAVIDLWNFVSGEVIGESAVRAARARAVRTSSV